MTLLVLTTHPIQYHAPIYRSLQTEFNIPTTVIYASDFSVTGYYDEGFGAEFSWDTDLLSGYTSLFLSRVADGGAKDSTQVSAKGINKLIRQVNPSAILVTGYRPRFDLRAFSNALRVGCPLLFRAPTLDLLETQRNSLKRILRDNFLKAMYSRIDHFLYLGELARKHYLRLGIPNEKLTFSPQCVNIEPFEISDEARNRLRSATRSRLHLREDNFVLLVSGKLISRKSPDLVLRAVKRLPESLKRNTVVLFLGDGEMRSELAEMVSESSELNARFLGFQNQSHLSNYYHAADLMILASQSEPWGLVVNEALHHGLPCVVSDRVGCAQDLISDGQTGYVFAYGSVEGLVSAITLSHELVHKSTTRLHCFNRIQKYSVKAAAEGVSVAYYLVCKTHKD